MNLESLLTFIGRLHPSIVHFPVALLVVGALLGLLGFRRPPSDTVVMLLRLGALSAVVAAGLGWLFAEHDPPARGLRDALLWHRWAGVGTAVLAVLAALAVGKARRAGRTGVQVPLLLVAIGVSWTGHLGGTMVYGDDFLSAPFAAKPSQPKSEAAGEESETQPTPAVEDVQSGAGPPETPGVSDSDAPVPAEAAETPGRTITFQEDVFPIFEKHCFECHGPEGPAKAGLRIYDEALFFEDVPELWVVLPGDPEGSLLLQLVSLPVDDEDHMPKKGPPLDADELAILRDWIEQLSPPDK